MGSSDSQLASALSQTEATISVNWSGGGDINPGMYIGSLSYACYWLNGYNSQFRFPIRDTLNQHANIMVTQSVRNGHWVQYFGLQQHFQQWYLLVHGVLGQY